LHDKEEGFPAYVTAYCAVGRGNRKSYVPSWGTGVDEWEKNKGRWDGGRTYPPIHVSNHKLLHSMYWLHEYNRAPRLGVHAIERTGVVVSWSAFEQHLRTAFGVEACVEAQHVSRSGARVDEVLCGAMLVILTS
jgi:hypothetical protein